MPGLRGESHDSYAPGRLRVLLGLPGLQDRSEAQGGRLLRVLLLRLSPVPARRPPPFPL